MKEYKGYNYKKEGETYTVYTEEGKPWVVKIATEEKAKEQIDTIIKSKENAQKEQTTMDSLQEQVTNLELALAEIYENGGN